MQAAFSWRRPGSLVQIPQLRRPDPLPKRAQAVVQETVRVHTSQRDRRLDRSRVILDFGGGDDGGIFGLDGRRGTLFQGILKDHRYGHPYSAAGQAHA